MKALVIGYGSIGERHARILKSLGVEVFIVSKHCKKSEYPCFGSVAEAVRTQKPDYAVIANETVAHSETLRDLKASGFRGTVLVEKPLFYSNEKFSGESFENIFVGYNLRFHPLIQKLRRALSAEKVISVQAYVGRYLPKWRPAADYKMGYSAKRSAGGGVLRDLSHEIDYLLWMLGDWSRVSAIGGHYSSLEIDADDAFGLLFSTQKCPLVTVQMNYLDRAGRRQVIVNADRHTFLVDLVSGEFWKDEEKETVNVERDDTYRAEHEAVLAGRRDGLCTLEEGLRIMEFIEAAENAAFSVIPAKAGIQAPFQSKAAQ